MVSCCAGVAGGADLGALRQPSSVSGTGQFQQWTPGGGGGFELSYTGLYLGFRHAKQLLAQQALQANPQQSWQWRCSSIFQHDSPSVCSFSWTASQLRPGWRCAQAIASSLEMRRPVAHVNSSGGSAVGTLSLRRRAAGGCAHAVLGGGQLQGSTAARPVNHQAQIKLQRIATHR